MPAEMRSKGRWDSLLPYWGQIIAIQYYRVFDTLSNKRNSDACIFEIYRHYYVGRKYVNGK